MGGVNFHWKMYLIREKNRDVFVTVGRLSTNRLSKYEYLEIKGYLNRYRYDLTFGNIWQFLSIIDYT